MPLPNVSEFLLDEDNVEKFGRHGVSVEQVLEVLEGEYRIKRNRKGRRAAYIDIGFDRQGRCIALPIEPTLERTLWRPVTAWPCKPSEAAWLR